MTKRAKNTPENKKYKEEFAKRLKQILEDKGWSQEDLSKQSGLPTNSISGWSTGKSIPRDPESWMRLCHALQVSSDTLLFGTAPVKMGICIEEKIEKQNGSYLLTQKILPKVTVIPPDKTPEKDRRRSFTRYLEIVHEPLVKSTPNGVK